MLYFCIKNMEEQAHTKYNTSAIKKIQHPILLFPIHLFGLVCRWPRFNLHQGEVQQWP